MSTLIAYYSLSGNVDYAAERMAGNLKADLLRLEVEDDIPSTGFKRYLLGGKSALGNETVKLKSFDKDPNSYDTVINIH